MTAPLFLVLAWTALVIAALARHRPARPDVVHASHPDTHAALRTSVTAAARTAVNDAAGAASVVSPRPLRRRGAAHRTAPPESTSERRVVATATATASATAAGAKTPGAGPAAPPSPRPTGAPDTPWRRSHLAARSARLPSARRRPTAGRRQRRQVEAAIADAVPDVIDLFAVAIAAGLNTRLALAAVAHRAPPGPLADALQRVEQDVQATGARLADTIERLPAELGAESVRPLVAAITDAERYGAQLGPTLDRLADDARRTRQRKAEEAARRIPVKLLFPLVTCILPAFGLLTVAPLIAGGLRALRL